MASPFFFVLKKDSDVLRPCQDYRYLNDGTVKNVYLLPLVSDLLDKLKGANIFIKLDIPWGYHNVRIKEGNKWKEAFKTNKGLFHHRFLTCYHHLPPWELLLTTLHDA
jgi:hypothetical protein